MYLTSSTCEVYYVGVVPTSASRESRRGSWAGSRLPALEGQPWKMAQMIVLYVVKFTLSKSHKGQPKIIKNIKYQNQEAENESRYI